MKYLLLLALLPLSRPADAQCCAFDLAYHSQVQEVPSLAELEACFGEKACDPRYYYTGKMIHAMRDADLDVVNKHFADLINIFEKTSTADDLTQDIIYTYARHLEIIGQGTQALAYYRLIEATSHEQNILKALAGISINGINGNTDAVLAIIESLNLASNDDISGSEKMQILINAIRYLNFDSQYKILKKYQHLHEASKNEMISFLYLMHLYFNLNYNNDRQSHEIWLALKSSSFDPYSSLFADKWVVIQSTKLSYSDEYDKALELSKNHIERKVGKFMSNNELLKIPQLSDKVSPDVIANYAHSNLFQTRLGKGLPPVIDAFNIYEAVYQDRLKRRMFSLNTITSESDVTGAHIPNDILIVGTYLFQKTRDVGYLNRTYSVINGMTSGGISYWANARAFMRRNRDFRNDILEEQRLVAAVQKTDEGATLREIYERQTALEAFRKSNENKHVDFYRSVTNSYAIDLEELQERMQRDTAACLNFFLDAQILYRLYVSPDTIDIFPVDDNARVRVLKLTKQLAAMVESGKSAKELEASGRELYDHLFEGIQENLPPRLHLIANGTLLDIPFAVLRKDAAGESPRYLGVDHAISRQFSLSTMCLLEDTELKPGYTRPLAMAPAFANEFLQAGELRQAGFQLPPLVYNTEELHDLQARGSGEYFYEEDATIGRYRDRASDYGIIHLATHAISSEVDGLRSRVYLLDDAGEPVGLYASDIGNQTLNSELVVLSACETGGGGRNYAEGRVGLTKAYLAAGARSVVASNWAVDDHATAEQMKTFYDGIEAGRPPHIALQAARRSYLEAHPDAVPYKWAAFEAYGGMAPVRWDKGSGADRWWWLALPVLGLGVTVFWNKRRSASRAA